VPDGKQMKNITDSLESVDDTVVAYAQPVPVAACQAMVRERRKPQPNLIDPGLDAGPGLLGGA
jgi:hypothetical protein